jgi:hypothetical protein
MTSRFGFTATEIAPIRFVQFVKFVKFVLPDRQVIIICERNPVRRNDD